MKTLYITIIQWSLLPIAFLFIWLLEQTLNTWVLLASTLIPALLGFAYLQQLKGGKHYRQSSRPKESSKSFDEAIKVQLPNLKKSLKPVIRIKATKIDHDTDPLSSKFGGVPYLKKGQRIPQDPNGKPMILLAQIMGKDIEKNSIIPKSGVLQFFIAEKFTDYDFTPTGINKAFFQIRYIERINKKYKAHIDSAIAHEEYDSPLKNNYFKLEFTNTQEPISLCDYRFYTTFGEYFLDDLDWDTDRIEKDYNLNISGSGHKLGGYPAFAQEDPRNNISEKYELLFQVDSQYNSKQKKYEIIWGDAGVGNFFIKPEDLAKKNFKNVIFSWDCG